jgi:hypothetical protein
MLFKTEISPITNTIVVHTYKNQALISTETMN